MQNKTKRVTWVNDNELVKIHLVENTHYPKKVTLLNKYSKLYEKETDYFVYSYTFGKIKDLTFTIIELIAAFIFSLKQEEHFSDNDIEQCKSKIKDKMEERKEVFLNQTKSI